jgi:uncharacterized protein YgbK (DUF1537 family)
MIVIADDITGAAEIAGIAFEHGQQVRLVCASPVGSATVSSEAITVVATDTRSMSEDEAVAETRRILHPLSLEGEEGRLHFFKKTDSALRGHVVAELSALMEATGYRRAVYLPANPSKGRIVRQGVCYVHNVPIHATSFSYDPEYPARTSVLSQRFPDADEHHIIMPDAETMDDVRHVVERYNDAETLFAGAADLFTSLLPASPSPLPSLHPHGSWHGHTPSESVLILCGSTQSKPLDLGIPVAPMPREVYDGSSDLTLWDTSAYNRQHSLILSIPHTHRTGKAVAVHLRTVMAAMTRSLVAIHRPAQLIIEGGATAWATLQALGWTTFEVVGQSAPGVVQMRSVTNRTLVTLKPGSYPWAGCLSRL